MPFALFLALIFAPFKYIFDTSLEILDNKTAFSCCVCFVPIAYVAALVYVFTTWEPVEALGL